MDPFPVREDSNTADSNHQGLLSPRESLVALGIEVLAIQIHDASFPSETDEDCGRGSPYSYGAERFFQFVAELGFNVVQLGPRGSLLKGVSSPYDATIFSSNPASLPLGRYANSGRLSRETLQRLRIPASQRIDRQGLSNTELLERIQPAIDEIVANSDENDHKAMEQYLIDNEDWLVPDALYDALADEHAAVWWRHWTKTPQAIFDQRLYSPSDANQALAEQRLQSLRLKYAKRILDYAFIQWLIHLEHQALRKRLAPLGIRLFADLQVGLSPQDIWARQHLFHPSYLVGAPPSRTNSEGQPWGFSVLDPEQLGTHERPGPGMQFVRSRLQRTMLQCDGVRIDHPQGWIDPWVYRSDDPDPVHAVQNGARLFSSPDEVEHPTLGAHAIADAQQIDLDQLPFADARVKQLRDAQVESYARLIDIVVQETIQHSGSFKPIACEILSTLPYPVRRVLDRYHLGRFRVVQKAKLDLPSDVYRIENAQAQDWIMFGTHDTPTIWQLASQWCEGEEQSRWTGYLASLSGQETSEAGSSTNRPSPGQLINRIFATMLSSRANHIAIFFPDLFGIKDRFNEPGVVSDANWRLRLPHDFEENYRKGCENESVLDIASCMEQALSVRKRTIGRTGSDQ